MTSSTSKVVITLLWYLCAISLHSVMSLGNLDVRCNVKDRETLEVFKGSIEDPWGLLSSWSSEEDCCHWLGVHCDNLTGRVTKLDLHCLHNSTDIYGTNHTCLRGQINLSVLKLEFLSYLNLSDNYFTAIHIPPIQRSYNISMRTTLHDGTNFSKLLFLDLSYNFGLQIEDLRWISQLSSLKYLDLSYANLSEEALWLQWITMLHSLTDLRLSHCLLNYIQPSLRYVNFSSLEVLDISNNEFSTQVPKWLFNLSDSIFHLDLSFNYFRGQVPKEMSDFQYLKFLILKYNNFKGSIPEWVGQYKQLEHLDISSNSFHGPIPETLGNLSSLAYLKVQHNQLNDSLPKSLGQLSKLQMFSAGYNFLSGPISHFLCQTMNGTKELMILEMTYNLLSGELSECWIHWKKHLKMILLRSNNLTGKIPSQICQLSNLQVLELAENKLSGSIPKCLGNITAMATINTPGDLFFKNYYYNGKKIERESLSTYLQNQPFLNRGPGHEYWDNLSKLMMLIDLSKNELSGLIPGELFSLAALPFLNLSQNHYLMGSIPEDIGHMKSLQSLDLSWNQLVGEIPQSLGNLSFLRFLNLSFNKFSGRIPLGPHLQSFDASSYMGNPGLFGTPLTKNYSLAEIPNQKKQIIEDIDDEFTKWFYMGMATGSAFGFWGVCVALLFIKTWRHAYFRFLNNVKDRIYHIFIALMSERIC